MTFRYVNLRGEPPRPMLWASVSWKDRATSVLFLVDSGSDDTLIPTFVADRIGLKPTAEAFPITGVSGPSALMVRPYEAQIRFGGGRFSYRDRVLVADNVVLPVLGHCGLFNRFRVSFDAGRRLFFIAPPRP